MKKFLTRIAILAVLLISIDFLVGKIGDFFVTHTREGGDTYRMTYIVNKSQDDVLVFGSSRATHHYDSQILEDSLKCSVYNCGFDANGILCNYAYFMMVLERHSPKLIIYDVNPEYDLLLNDNHQYLGLLKYFFSHDAVKEVMGAVDKTEPWKMRSAMFRYNYKFPQLITEYFKPIQFSIKGYKPRDWEMKLVPSVKNNHNRVYTYDSLKLSYFEKLISECKQRNIKLVLTASPLCMNEEYESLAQIVEWSHKYGVPFISHYTDEKFNKNTDFFYDSVHLNCTGATAYTKTIVHELKALF